MPRVFNDFSDERNKAWCIHCGSTLSNKKCNRDHVPSRTLLNKPYPENLSIVIICEDCNEDFSKDEEYTSAFLSAVLSGSTDPDLQKIATGKRVFTENKKLRARIEKSKIEYETQSGSSNIVWRPEIKRIENVVLKNSRGHAYFELGEPLMEKPNFVSLAPIPSMSKSSKAQYFGTLSSPSGWGEVGSVWMNRLMVTANWDEYGFLEVQPDVYGFRIDTDSGISIKTVLHNYLATEVVWNDI